MELNTQTDNRLFIKIKGLPIIEFERNLLSDDIFEVDFGGSYKLQITNENGTFVITNAMNGYGDNCYEQFKGESVSFLEYYDYAMSIANQSVQSITLTPSELKERDEKLIGEAWDAADRRFAFSAAAIFGGKKIENPYPDKSQYIQSIT